MITVYDYTGFNPADEVEKVLSFACEKLGVNDVTVVASLNEKLLRKLSKYEVDYQAVLFKNKGVNHIYTLYFRPRLGKATYTEILCHEAVHLAQQERGDLSLNLTTGECRWKGELYAANSPYMERPWEKEAFKIQSDLQRAYKKFNKSNKPNKKNR